MLYFKLLLGRIMMQPKPPCRIMGTLKTSGRIMKVEKTSEKNLGFGVLKFFLFVFLFSPLPCRNQRERTYANYMANCIYCFV